MISYFKDHTTQLFKCLCYIVRLYVTKIWFIIINNKPFFHLSLNRWKFVFMQSASKKCSNLCIRPKGHKPILQLIHLQNLSHTAAYIHLIRTQFHSLHKRWKNFVWIKYDYMINTFCFHGHISSHDAEALFIWLRLEKQYYNLHPHMYIYHRYLVLLAVHCRKFDIEI